MMACSPRAAAAVANVPMTSSASYPSTPTTGTPNASRICSMRSTERSKSCCSSCVRTSTRSEEHTSELQSLAYLVCRLLLEKKKKNIVDIYNKYHPHRNYESAPTYWFVLRAVG